ncbi:hypothetical protein [Luteimonas gilva]|uniref:hypothetical protein n=1 Tax=Luteimonas gilva TaxID=2572684 RepID=UPI0016781D29|nr:hypothetical protein [Luteimonas gilva]
MIESGPIVAAPLSAQAICADCATADELRATSARPRKGEASPEGLEIQAEAKRRLLQGP